MSLQKLIAAAIVLTAVVSGLSAAASAAHSAVTELGIDLQSASFEGRTHNR